MAMTIEEKRERQYQKAREVQARARERQLAKLKDPAEQQKRREKELERAKRAAEKLQRKVSDPVYRQQQQEKARAQLAKAMSKAKERAASKPPAKRKATRGLKGRTPTAQEKRIMDAVGKLPCIACYGQGRDNPIVSLHHIAGRTAELAHARVIPLCCHHHDTPAEKHVIEQYPDLVPVHARGNLGGKAQFNRQNGTEEQLLRRCYELAELDIPDSLFS